MLSLLFLIVASISIINASLTFVLLLFSLGLLCCSFCLVVGYVSVFVGLMFVSFSSSLFLLLFLAFVGLLRGFLPLFDCCFVICLG